MRWESGRRSSNVEDRRGLGMLPGGIGIGGLALVVLLSLITGQNPLTFLQLLGGGDTAVSNQPAGTTGKTPDDPQAQFASVVLADTEDTWTALFKEDGRTYEPPTLVLFDEATRSGCGTGNAAVGPFYCPADRRVYLDLSFFRELDRRFGAPGDFAQAYVIAHEVGHHVQTLLGVTERVDRERAGAGRAGGNALSVRVELQADCLAGVWGHHAGQRNLLDPGDIEEGLRAAAAIGDDRLQRQAQGYTVPETWTHGSSEQRATWLRRGFERGRIEACDTFGAGT